MHDLIIIGGGPAGLTAAIYAVRKHLDVQLITKDIGGKANYRLQLPDIKHHLVITGEEVVSRFASEIEYLDFARTMEAAETVRKNEDGFAVRTADGGRYESRALIYATGASPRPLGIPGEEQFLGRGLSYSAVSYAPLFVERDTVVIGDGILALRAAAELAAIADSVTLIAPTRGDLDRPLGEILADDARVDILEGWEPIRVQGDEFARELTIARDDEERVIRADAFFVELGLVPMSAMVEGLVELDDDGAIAVDQRNRTATPGLFAAGDVTNAHAEQVLIAVGEGAKAALSAHAYLLEDSHA